MGQSGDGVRDLQKMLGVVADGKFGPITDRAVRAFQRAHGLTVDGEAGMNTIHALREAAAAKGHANHTMGAHRAPTPTERQQRPAGTMTAGSMQQADNNAKSFAPSKGRARGSFSSSQATREQQAAALLQKQGVQLKEGHTYVVQIDQDPPKSRDTNYEHSYTGQTVVMRAHNGKLDEVGGVFQTSSHPGQDYPVGSDGVPGTAFIRPGAYEYTKSLIWHHGKQRFNPLESMPAARDTNHDGTISGSERWQQYTASAIQWHPGDSFGPSSTGCQNVDPSQWDAFMNAVKAGGGSTFTYVLARRANDHSGANAF
jgi:hypothetical protein